MSGTGRLTEGQRKQIQEPTIVVINEAVYSAVERIVGEAVAAAEAAENAAAQSDILAASVNTDKGASWVKSPNDVAGAIRSRMTPAHVSALEQVRQEARESVREISYQEGKLHGLTEGMQKAEELLAEHKNLEDGRIRAYAQECNGLISRAEKSEAEAKRLREYLRWAMPFVPLLYTPHIKEIGDFLDALSAPAGAAQAPEIVVSSGAPANASPPSWSKKTFTTYSVPDPSGRTMASGGFCAPVADPPDRPTEKVNDDGAAQEASE